MYRKIKMYILSKPRLRNIIVPLYFLIRAPYYILRYKAYDPPQYFIFKGKQLVYLVNSKVAQTTIKNTCGNEIKKEYAGIKEKHLAEQKQSLTQAEKNYTAFTFVRNPFDRLYSCYCSKYITDKEKGLKEILDFDFYLGGILRRDRGFEHFVRMVCRIPDSLADRHFKSQYALIYKQSVIELNTIGLYESIEKDFEQIRTTYHLEKLPHLNPSGKQDWRKAYTPELVRMVAKRYKRDLDTWYPEEEVRLYHFLHTLQS